MRASLILVWAVFPAIAIAHHSQSFFSDEVTEFAGELLELQWKNPHIVLLVEIPDASGQTETWRFEADSIYVLQRGGVTRDVFRAGDQVVVAAYRSNRTAREGLIVNLMLPDGREVLLHTRAEPRWSGEVIGEKMAAPDHVVVQNTAEENSGIFRVWSSPRPADRVMHLPFTDAAVAARASFNLIDNFATRCEPEGMPRLMRNPHPFEFVDEGPEILMRSELYDLVRTIHMGTASPPPGQQGSPLGYSLGAWEDGNLVVRTTGINWPYFDNIGTPQSEAVEIVERFTLSDDQSRIDYHITITDPSTFIEPATIQGHWLALGEAIEPYECSIY